MAAILVLLVMLAAALSFTDLAGPRTDLALAKAQSQAVASVASSAAHRFKGLSIAYSGSPELLPRPHQVRYASPGTLEPVLRNDTLPGNLYLETGSIEQDLLQAAGSTSSKNGVRPTSASYYLTGYAHCGWVRSPSVPVPGWYAADVTAYCSAPERRWFFVVKQPYVGRAANVWSRPDAVRLEVQAAVKGLEPAVLVDLDPRIPGPDTVLVPLAGSVVQ